MSIELLDKTRKINRLLNEQRSSKVAFKDICMVLGQILQAAVYVISSKGKILGGYTEQRDNVIKNFKNEQGKYIETKLNERFLSVLSTKENVNLETLGFPKEEVDEMEALITPISIAGSRYGTLFVFRKTEPFVIEDIILSEYSTTVVGLEMMRAVQEESDIEKQQQEIFSSAMETLTLLEQKSVAFVIHELGSREGMLVTSKLAAKIGITRTVIVNALRKLESAGIIQTKSLGMKGTHIEVLNETAYINFENDYKEKWNS